MFEIFTSSYTLWLFFAFSFIIALIYLRKYFNGAICDLKGDLTSKVIIITGANRGIGQIAAMKLAALNATIIMGCRDIQKAEEVKVEMLKKANYLKLDIMHLDLSDMQSIRNFVKAFKLKYQRLDVLINNAGVISDQRKLTKDGLELMMATNYLGPFLLTNLLLDILKSSKESRVISLSSNAHAFAHLDLDDMNNEKYFKYVFNYGGTKLAILTFIEELAKRLEGTNVKVCSLHPGVIRTNIFLEGIKNDKFSLVFYYLFYFLFVLMTKNVEQGTQTILHCVLLDHAKLESGKYYVDCKVASHKTKDNDFMKRLWDISEKIVKL